MAQFHAAHEAAYGYRMAEREVEVVNLRLTVRVPRPAPPVLLPEVVAGPAEDAISASRDVWFAGAGYVTTPVYRRERLPAETEIRGPAVIEQMDATTIVPPDAAFYMDRLGNLHLMLTASDTKDDGP